jgi:ERCC4-type nuclease
MYTVLHRDYMARALEAAGVRVLVRSLPLGDMMWVVTGGTSVNQSDRCDPTSVRGHLQPKEVEEEYVCPYIVERKTAADLRASISDARYKEQKYRLAVCNTVVLLLLLQLLPLLLIT